MVFDLFHSFLVKYLHTYENGYGQFFDKLIDEYNLLLRARSNFFQNWPDKNRHHFNMTFAQPPELNAETQMISAALDGTIYDTVLRTTHVNKTTTKAE